MFFTHIIRYSPMAKARVWINHHLLLFLCKTLIVLSFLLVCFTVACWAQNLFTLLTTFNNWQLVYVLPWGLLKKTKIVFKKVYFIFFIFFLFPDLESVVNTQWLGESSSQQQGQAGGVCRASAPLQTATHWQTLPIIVDFSFDSRAKISFSNVAVFIY